MNMFPSTFPFFPFSIPLHDVTNPRIIAAAAAYALEKAVYDKENPQEHDVGSSEDKKGTSQKPTSERKVSNNFFLAKSLGFPDL
jgi:hypothetical protein